MCRRCSASWRPPAPTSTSERRLGPGLTAAGQRCGRLFVIVEGCLLPAFPMIDPATATRVVDELVELMRLEPLGNDRFLAPSEDLGTPEVFGGQVLGQSLMAASRTVETDRPPHSMHAYFLLPGEHAPIEYSVDRVRDGRSFTTRHVVARQGERIIFEMSASFQTVDDGVDHQIAMPAVAGPDGLSSEREQRMALGDRLPER